MAKATVTKISSTRKSADLDDALRSIAEARRVIRAVHEIEGYMHDSPDVVEVIMTRLLPAAVELLDEAEAQIEASRKVPS